MAGQEESGFRSPTFGTNRRPHYSQRGVAGDPPAPPGLNVLHWLDPLDLSPATFISSASQGPASFTNVVKHSLHVRSLDRSELEASPWRIAPQRLQGEGAVWIPHSRHRPLPPLRLGRSKHLRCAKARSPARSSIRSDSNVMRSAEASSCLCFGALQSRSRRSQSASLPRWPVPERQRPALSQHDHLHIAVAAITSLRTTGTKLRGTFTNVSNAL